MGVHWCLSDGMRAIEKDLTEILEGKLYLSSIRCARARWLRRRKFKAVVTLLPAETVFRVWYPGIRPDTCKIKSNTFGVYQLADIRRSSLDTFHVPIFDAIFAPIAKYLDPGIEFIHQHIQKGEKTLVHCAAGRSRSTTMHSVTPNPITQVIAYLVAKCGFTLRAAFHHCKVRRPIVAPNIGFVQALVEFERRVVAKENEKLDVKENGRKKRELSMNFLGEYVINERMGGEEVAGVTPEALQKMIDDCNGNVSLAQVEIML
eukprot:1376648-Amorphochlora_amoeboformis.AAC.1